MPHDVTAPRPVASLALVAFLAFAAIALLRARLGLEFPVLYGEDGFWIGHVATEGFWNYAFEGRGDFPVLGLMLLETLSLKLALSFGSDITVLPYVIAVVASLVFGLVATLPLLTLGDRLSRASCLLVGLAIVLLPVGQGSYEIFGRILNLGFYMPVIAQFLLFALLYRAPPRWAVVLLHLGVLVLMWTFPVVIGQYVLFIVFDQLRRTRNRWWPLAGSLLLIALALSALGSDIVTKTGGVSDPFDARHLVEFALARSLLFPAIAVVYLHLGDPWVLGITAAFVASVGLYALPFRKRGIALTDYRIFLLLSFGLMLAATLVMRRGLTSMFDDYATSAPDRYYTGTNVMFLVAWMVFALSNPLRGLRRLASAGFVAMIASWLFLTPSLVEDASPYMQRNFGTLSETICERQAGRGPIFPSPAPGYVVIPTYPVTPAQEWRMAIEQDVFDRTARRRCANGT